MTDSDQGAAADLAAAFAVHAEESMAVANETFPSAAQVWLRECVWPDCLTLEQQLQLVDEIGCELPGETHPEPALYDQRATCRCAESARTQPADPGDSHS